MHVALCTDGIFPHAMGGMQRHSRLLAEHLARSSGVQLTVIHPHEVPVFAAGTGIQEVRVQGIDEEKFYLLQLRRYSDRVGKVLDRIAPDVILSQGFCVWDGIERFSDHLIVHPHGLEMFQMLTKKEQLLGWPFRRAIGHIARQSKVVISLGGKLTGILREQVKGSPCEVVVLPNAVELPQRSPDPERSTPSSGPLDLLFVGRFAFNKGLDVLLNVAERLVREGEQDLVRFQLAGDGPLLKKIQEDGIPENVELLGRVDDARLANLYAACDAFILPTRFEGMPTVVLEAMAHAKPIIVSDVGATAELVTPHNGYLLPPGDADALYHAIRSFSERAPEVHRAMGKWSFEAVQERYSWPAVTRAYVDLFQRISSERVRS